MAIKVQPNIYTGLPKRRIFLRLKAGHTGLDMCANGDASFILKLLVYLGTRE